MAICNILGDMQNSTGNFLTFSQYIEDLTRWQADASYKVSPSKFIALNLRSFKRNIIKGFVQTNNYNSWIPSMFTNFLENRCAWLKTYDKYGRWNPNHFKNVFWEVLTTQQENVNSSLIAESEPIMTKDDIMYVGNIDINSYNNINGQGYSEIYCYIPNEATKESYEIQKKWMSDIDRLDIDISGELIEQNKKLTGFDNIGEDWEYVASYNMKYSEPREDYNIIRKDSVKGVDKFNINAIIVLYDIKNGDIDYKDIPMGIYFTGLIDENRGENEGKIQNSITKYVSNNDIYGSGTAYGLRICSRYATSYQQGDITISDNNNPDISKLLSKISQTYDKLNDVLDKFNSNNNVNKSLIDLFKNTQVNVPYVKEIHGVKYWFVNGKKITSVYESDSKK